MWQEDLCWDRNDVPQTKMCSGSLEVVTRSDHPRKGLTNFLVTRNGSDETPHAAHRRAKEGGGFVLFERKEFFSWWHAHIDVFTPCRWSPLLRSSQDIFDLTRVRTFRLSRSGRSFSGNSVKSQAHHGTNAITIIDFMSCHVISCRVPLFQQVTGIYFENFMRDCHK